ncbi:MAG: hypothetical protein ACF8OB_05675 [Phycisphaeraceae bacterium JB051]
MTENDFNQYRKIVMDLIQQAPLSAKQTADLDDLMSVARLMIEDAPSTHQTLIDGISKLAAGQKIEGLDKRPVYPLLAMHVHLAAFAKRYLVLPDNIWETAASDFETLAKPLRAIEQFKQTAPGYLETETVLWQAWLLLLIGSLRHADDDIALAKAVVNTVVEREVPEQSLTVQDIEDTLDAWTYRELIGLHALANAALFDRNDKWADRVEEVAMHHLYNTQPDHCTSEPWGLFGFLWSDKTRMFGVQQIHDCKAYGLVGVGRILLADAMRCLNEFEE